MDDLTGNTRRIKRTWDGKPIGYTEPLETGNPMRKNLVRYLKSRAALQKSSERGRKNGRITAALTRNAAARA